MRSSYFYIVITIMLFSCRNNNEEKLASKQLTKRDVTNLRANSFVFINPNRISDKIFVIPTDIVDSLVFKKVNIKQAIENKVSIQLVIGRENALKLENDPNRDSLDFKPCNIPSEYSVYSRVYIEYKNYSDTDQKIYYKTHNRLYRDEDSCNSKSIFFTDSSSLDIFYVY